MTSKTHNLFAVSSLVTLSVNFPKTGLTLPTIITGLIFSVIGSLLPDMDQSSNRLWDLFPGGDVLGRLFRPFFLGHRSLSHSLLGLWLVNSFFAWLLPRIFNPEFIDPVLVQTSVMVGMISHLLADGITEEGVPLLFPLRLKFGFPPIQSWRIVTGKWFENLIIFPGLAIYLIYLIFYLGLI